MSQLTLDMADKPVVETEDDLKDAYFEHCSKTKTFLAGVRDVVGMKSKSYCLVGYEDGQHFSGPIQPIPFHDPFWFEVMAVFSSVRLGHNLEKKTRLSTSHGSVISQTID